MCGTEMSAGAVARIRSTAPGARPPVRAPAAEAPPRPEPGPAAHPGR